MSLGNGNPNEGNKGSNYDFERRSLKLLEAIANATSGGLGGVTSVGLSMPSEFSVANSPIITNGTLTVTKASQNQNLVYASPDGIAGVPTFRQLVAADIPALPYATSVGLSLPSADWTITNSPVTGSGTLTGTYKTQSANRVFAGPTTGAAATPSFRALVSDDIPGIFNQDFLMLGTRGLNVANNTTVFAPLVGDIASATGFAASEVNVYNVLPYNITATGIKVYIANSMPATQTLTVRLRDDAANTALLLTINPSSVAGVYSATGSVNVDADSLVNWQLINSAGGSATANIVSIVLLFKYR
jgi:hypothetical protein